jgi:hypothetical protein
LEKPIPAKGYLYILVVLYDGLSDELGIKEAVGISIVPNI